MLDRLAGIPGCLFVSEPDVVGDARATLDRFGEWREEIAGRGFPVALVGQDGAARTELPWDEMDAFFLGGSTEWKLSAEAAELASHAAMRGKWVHMGRVNSKRRLRIASDLGCDSVDGSGWSKFPDVYMRGHIPTVAALNSQPLLWEK